MAANGSLGSDVLLQDGRNRDKDCSEGGGYCSSVSGSIAIAPSTIGAKIGGCRFEMEGRGQESIKIGKARADS